MKNIITIIFSISMVSLVAAPSIAADAKLHQRLTILKSKAGTDHRVIVDSTQAPWRAIGRLNSRLGSHCTATVVAPKRILTAAHCLWNKRTLTYLPVQSLHFVAGWSKGDYLFASKVTAIHPAKNYDARKQKTLLAFADDWAYVDLAEDPVPVTGLIKIETGKSLTFQVGKAATGPYTQAGYSADKRHVLTAHVGCPIWGIDRKLKIAIHGCNALPGDSGSPILVPKADDSVSVIGIHVGYASTKTGTGKGIAVPATSFK